MIKTINQGVNFEVKLIDPSELPRMDKDDIIVVNRIRLNSKLVEYEIQNIKPSEAVIIRQAISLIKQREIRSKNAVMGVEMRVGDVLKIFPEYKSLPKNSFAVSTV